MVHRPKLSKGKSESLPAATPKLRAPKTDVIQIEKPEVAKSVKRGARFIFGMVLSAVLVLVFLYLSLAATLMAVVPSGGNLTWVARSTFVGGVPEQGQFAYTTSDVKSDNTMLNRVLQGTIGVSDGSTVEVVAGPFSEVHSNAAGEIISDGEPTGYMGDVTKRVLNNEYIAICLEGECETGESLIVPQWTIVGESKGRVSTDGITTFDSIIAEQVAPTDEVPESVEE